MNTQIFNLIEYNLPVHWRSRSYVLMYHFLSFFEFDLILQHGSVSSSVNFQRRGICPCCFLDTTKGTLQKLKEEMFWSLSKSYARLCHSKPFYLPNYCNISRRIIFQLDSFLLVKEQRRNQDTKGICPNELEFLLSKTTTMYYVFLYNWLK